MKAQRRHELQQSDLAKVIKQAPGFWQQSGGRWLLAAVAVLVVVLLIRYRNSSNAQAAAAAKESLAMARAFIEDLHSPQMAQMTMFSPPSQTAMQRRQIFSNATNAIQDVTRLSDDRMLAAEALVARGDLSWAAASLPEIPGAATQQTLNLRDPKELLANAADAYRTVVESYSDQKPAVIAARFGLAAIGENQQNWDNAKQQYDAILASTTDIDPYHQLAQARASVLPKLKEPVVMGKPATEPAPEATTGPSTGFVPGKFPFVEAPKSSTTRPAGATTMPTTKSVAAAPAAPATAPTTKP